MLKDFRIVKNLDELRALSYEADDFTLKALERWVKVTLLSARTRPQSLQLENASELKLRRHNMTKIAERRDRRSVAEYRRRLMHNIFAVLD